MNVLALLGSALGIPNLQMPDLNVNGQAPPKPQVAPMQALLPDQSPSDAAPIRLGNHDFIQQSLQDQQNSAPGAQKGDLQHKGMLGVHGTLRDILGTLGDAFLTQAGRNSIYAPQKQQEKLSDAMAGFTQGDPRAAPERLAGVPGAAEFAQKMYEQTVQNQTRQAAQQSTDAFHKATQDAKTATMLGGLFANANANNWGGPNGVKARALAMAKSRGYDLNAALGGELPDEYDPNTASALRFFGGTPAQASTALYRDQILPIKQQTADAATTNARTGQGRLGEASRHNRVTESIGQENANTNAAYRQGQTSQGADRNAENTAHHIATEESMYDNANTKRVAAGLAPLPPRPPRGTVVNGLRYMGGDPSNKNNWVKKK